MSYLMNLPRLVFVLSLIVLWLAAILGAFIGERLRPLKEEERDDFSVVQSAILTLLGLLIGFTFSMAISRYDQRKSLEEAEANAIGTEYVRADLLPAADAARARTLLSKYLDQRILFYKTREARQLEQINAYYRSVADGSVVDSPRSRSDAAKPDYCPCRLRHERCFEFAGLH